MKNLTPELIAKAKAAKSCLTCGGTIGKIPLMPGPSGVKCEKCGTIILDTYTDKDIEMI